MSVTALGKLWSSVVVFAMLTSFSLDFAQAQEMGTVDDPLPTDALGQPLLAQTERVQRLLDHAVLFVSETTFTTVSVDWGDGRVHDFSPDGDNGLTWTITNRRGDANNRVTLAFIADGVVPDPSAPQDGDWGLVTGVVLDGTGLTENGLYPIYMFYAVGDQGAANFGIWALSSVQVEPISENPLEWNWVPLGYGLAEPTVTTGGISYEPIVYDMELTEYAIVGGLIVVMPIAVAYVFGGDLDLLINYMKQLLNE